VKQPVRANICQSRKADGTLCQRRINPGTKHCWQHAHGLKAKWRSFTRNQTVRFVLTTVLGLLLAVVVPVEGSTLVGLLSGPRVAVQIQGLRVTTGNAARCVTYMVGIATPPDRVIEQLYLTLQFPGNIASYKFGAGSAAVLGTGPGLAAIAVFELGKDANGECAVVQAAVAPSPDLTAIIDGPGMVQMRGNRIIPNTMVMGYFALSVKEPSLHPATMFKEGYFEYTRFGYVISKPLEFFDSGVHDAR
jgi:hypothetical protein